MDKLRYETNLIKKGYKYVCGVDEVGRGPLAGPVVCAAVIMPVDDIIDGVDDSKKLTEKKRQKLAEEIKKKAIAYAICRIEPQIIDEINILQATRLCMKNAIESLDIKPDFVHVLYKGRIVRTGGPELALELEERGYDWIKEEVDN